MQRTQNATGTRTHAQNGHKHVSIRAHMAVAQFCITAPEDIKTKAELNPIDFTVLSGYTGNTSCCGG